MTAENNGTGATPEGDDPFAHLYRQEGGDGSTAAAQQRVPRRSYNQVRTVGERQYGGQYGGSYGGQPAYGQAAGQQTQGGPQGQQPGSPYGQQPSAHYAAPETVPGGRAATRQGGPAGGGHGRGAGGRNRNGLLVGAIAVVAAVVIGIGAAVVFNSNGDDEGGQAADPPAAQTDGGAGDGKDDGGRQKQQNAGLHTGQTVGKEDAASLRLDGGAAPGHDVTGAKGKNGMYVGPLAQPGASATWTVNDVPKSGMYTFFVRYSVPGQDADSTLTVNGTPRSGPLNMHNFAHAQNGDWAKGWTQTYAWVDLKKGQNTIKVSCEQGNTCNFALDQVWLRAGKVQ